MPSVGYGCVKHRALILQSSEFSKIKHDMIRSTNTVPAECRTARGGKGDSQGPWGIIAVKLKLEQGLTRYSQERWGPVTHVCSHVTSGDSVSLGTV